MFIATVSNEISFFWQSRNKEWNCSNIVAGVDGALWMLLRVFLCRKHEWEKHGTCSMTLPSLNSELKYFSAGLNLSLEFNLLK